jgi:hypothetical protein
LTEKSLSLILRKVPDGSGAGQERLTGATKALAAREICGPLDEFLVRAWRKRPAPRMSVQLVVLGLVRSSNPDRASKKRQKCTKKDARIGDLAIGRYRIDLPLARWKCA